MEANKTYEMACTIPFGYLREIWALIWGDAIFPLFLVYLADLDALSHHVYVQECHPESLCTWQATKMSNT